MPAPYSRDLRKRVVKAYLSGRGTYVEVALIFNVGPATVDRWVSLMRRTGSVEPSPMGGDRHSKFDAESESHLAAMVQADVGATREELVTKVRAKLGLIVSPSAIQRALARLRLTRKKRRSMLRNATPIG